MNSSEPTQNRRTSTGSGSDQTTNADYVASKPTSLRNRHEVDTSPSSPLTTHPEKKVTLRSMTSLRSTLPKTDGPIIGQEHSHRQLSLLQCLKAILFASKINVMLIFIPIGIVAAKLHWPDVAVFILNFLAIVPLAKLLGYATEEISLRLGENLGALLNASFGNAVELILSIIALKEGKIAVVQASVLGSVLSNLLLHLSYGTSIVLLVVYVLYLVFQLKTHTHLYATDSSEEEEPILPLWLGIVVLLIITVIVAFCAEFLVGSIDGLSHSWNISPTFIGLILLPIVGNAAEHVTAVSVAMKDKMDLAIGVAIGSSMQIALFVTPLMVIIGWIIHQPMTLFFNTFETCVLFVSVLIVNYLIQDGESNWLEGVMLLSTYLIVAIAIYFYPASAVESGGQ
ncbi:hypothetical protein BGZ54_002167 [Gamsiella multidivaricata]|nr:hypothetical protein BGZ54_002167 [Gamsiella multidivaricata]